MLLRLHQLNKYFGDHPIVEDLNLTINGQDRIGLVGRNGVGKTTLLKILAGTMGFDSGQRTHKDGLSIGYLQQDIDFQPGRSLHEEMACAFPELAGMQIRLQEIEKLLAVSPDPGTDGYQRLMREYGTIQTAFEQRDGYSLDARIRTILNGLGFTGSAHERDAGHLSGGEKMRLHLGKLLLMEPDLLLLDEPNNHLDMDTMEWLEAYLLKWRKAMVVISHDRYFLDHVVTSIAELENCTLRLYKGNYSAYVQAKEARLLREEKEYRKQQQQIRHLDAYIERFRYKATKARQAQSKIKAKERLEPVERTHVSRKKMKLRFSVHKASEREVLHVEDLAKHYGARQVFTNLNFTLRRGERVGILGPNGVGKSTLLKMLVGNDQDYGGRILLAPGATLGYFAQDLPLEREDHRVLDEILALDMFHEGEARNLLGLFLFSGDDVFKQVSMLSGGERNRLALAKLVTRQANLLVLDEPTNHLDIESREVLEAALADYPGTLILVSHDRYFLSRITNRIFVMTESGLDQFEGSYSEYLHHKQMQREQQEAAAAASREARATGERKKMIRPEEIRRQQVRRKQRIMDLEERITALEEEKLALEEQMAYGETYQNGDAARQAIVRYDQIQTELTNCYEEWETCHEEES